MTHETILVNEGDALHCGFLALLLRHGHNKFWQGLDVFAASYESRPTEPPAPAYHWLGADADA